MTITFKDCYLTIYTVHLFPSLAFLRPPSHSNWLPLTSNAKMDELTICPNHIFWKDEK